MFKLIREAIIISLIQHFEADFLWKVNRKNPEFRIDPENFHPCIYTITILNIQTDRSEQTGAV